MNSDTMSLSFRGGIQDGGRVAVRMPLPDVYVIDGPESWQGAEIVYKRYSYRLIFNGTGTPWYQYAGETLEHREEVRRHGTS